MENNYFDVNWNLFILEDIFEISKGIYLHSSRINAGKIPYITAKSVNNGTTAFINDNSLFKNNSITIEKINLSAFYQSSDFYCSHDVSVLLNNELNRFNSLFICSIITRNGIKYNYGRQAQMKVVKRERILLPIKSDISPDYEYMEEYSKTIFQRKEKEYIDYIQKRIGTLGKFSKPKPLQDKKWETFRVIDIFEKIQRGKRLKKDDHIQGNIPYASSTSLNNGIDGFVGNETNVRIFNNCLTLANSGSVGCTFYQPSSVVASDHVTMLQNISFNKYIYLFLASMLSRLNEKYSFNREINDSRLSKEKILLPINSDGSPDYEYMEKYMKYKEYIKLKEYLDFKTK